MTILEKIEQKGKLEEKHEVLIRQISRKFNTTLTKQEKELIESVVDFGLLDSALDEILFADNKEAVLNCLRD